MMNDKLRLVNELEDFTQDLKESKSVISENNIINYIISSLVDYLIKKEVSAKTYHQYSSASDNYNHHL